MHGEQKQNQKTNYKMNYFFQSEKKKTLFDIQGPQYRYSYLYLYNFFCCNAVYIQNIAN